MGLIDFHAHLHPNEKALEILLDSMRRNEIDKTVVVAGGVLPFPILSRNIALGGEVDAYVDNCKIRALCDDAEGKLFPFYFANPHRSTEEYKEIGSGFHGLKLAPIVHGVPLNDPRHHEFLKVARKFQHPVYMHCLPRSGFDIEAFRDLALNFPDVSIILGHGGVNTADFYAVDRICEIPNTFFETSGPFYSVVTYAAKKLGLDRILFGTEHPLQAARVEVEKIRATGLPLEQLNCNARRLLHG